MKRKLHGYTILMIYSRLNVLEGKYPSCPQATLASALFHPSSHTEPHTLWTQISTLPIVGLLPPTSLMLPCVQLVTSTDWPSTINNCQVKITRITLLLYCKLRCVIHEVLVTWLLLISVCFVWVPIPVYCTQTLQNFI